MRKRTEKGTNQILESLSYVYDANGNRTKMDRQNVSVKLPNAVTNTSYNSANQMLTFNDKAIAYDNNGDMTSVTNSCGTTTYTWDARNRLVGIAGFNTDCSLLTASFKYDALGRRIEKTINGKTINYLYDGLDIVQEIENGTVMVNYIRTLNIDEPLARIKADGTIRYYQQDALGSVIALTDETGVIKTQYIYDPFGNVTVSGEPSDNPFQFAGRENDGTGLLFERNRYLSFELQRYIAQDPIKFAGGDVNWYVRVGNNPVNFVDPLGLHTLRDPRTGQPRYHRHGKDKPHLGGNEKCKKGPVELELPPTGGTEAFEEAMRTVISIYYEALSIAVGLGVAIETGNPQRGYEVYDILSNTLKAVQGKPASLPFVPIDIINPQGTE